MKIKSFILTLMTMVSALSLSAQKWEYSWNGSIDAYAAEGEYLPFWQRTGHDGTVPYYSSGMITWGMDAVYGDKEGWNFEMGSNLVGIVPSGTSDVREKVFGFVDRLYLSGSWRMLHMDIGLKPRSRELSDISISGGNVMWSRNARNIPGINMWSDWISFKKAPWFAFKGNFAHYQMNDNRYVEGTLLHNKALSMKFVMGGKVDLSLGMEQWAQWGGNSPQNGKQPVSFMDYVRVFFGRSGGDDATLSDRVNVLGNHLGKEYVRLDWREEDFTLTAQYDKPFEDRSGMEFQNAPDGIWSLQCSLKKADAWVTDIIYEFITTTWQSGTVHDRPATKEEMAEQDPDSHYYGKVVIGGCDNYFGNSEYKSGWTYYNRVIGCPLLLPSAPDKDGLTLSMASTRVRAHHFGLKGLAFNKFPYKFLFTYSENYGRYAQSGTSPFAGRPRQISWALEAEVKKEMMDLPIGLVLGLYQDMGELYQNSFGVTVRLVFGDGREF